MNYPIWELTSLGGATLIAIMAVFHVYISHLAVGGGLFLWLTDWKGFRENKPDIHAYVHKHLRVYLLLTMVVGGITGVGIWFVIALIHPAATSALIHTFVFGWAIEWVFFIGEIVALLVYFYYFDRLDRKSRLMVGFLYALFAWLSLFIINGILSFMLTPGAWLETRQFWDGFLNPTFLPSLFFRTFIAVMFAGLFGYVTAVLLKPGAFRADMIAYCTRWLLYPFLGLIPSGLWYYYAVPADIRRVAFEINHELPPYLYTFLIASALIFALGLLINRLASTYMQRFVTAVLVIIGLSWMGGFEYMREISRRPYVIHAFMYSTAIAVQDVDTLNKDGVLPHAKWTSVHAVTSDNRLQAGKELFNIHCLSCHTVGGVKNDILPHTQNLTQLGMVSFITGMGKTCAYMPQFIGTEKEKDALAAYIAEELHGKSPVKPAEFDHVAQSTEIPPFDMTNDDYVLLAWNDLGMHCISDSDPWFVILPPANTLEAQLIKRGPKPQIVREGVELTYRVQEGFENPAGHVRFWEHSESLIGRKIERNIGLSGKGLSGTMEYSLKNMAFVAPHIPVVPYADDGTYNPYPLFTIEARDARTNALLAQTRVVAPTSTGMGCRNCHGGGWRKDGIAGLSDETAMNILKAHDKLSKTELLKDAQNGNPKLCQSCHADPALGAKGLPGQLHLSAAIHGFHANFMPYDDERACALCHPADPEGQTRCFRGIHNTIGLTCVECHGTLQEHALSLLNGQQDKPSVDLLMRNLKPTSVENPADVAPRTPWLNQPDCLFCHVNFDPPEDLNAFNNWVTYPEGLYRKRTDNIGIRCEACHGSPHAIYPTENAYGENRDNIQPMQYGKLPYPIGANKSCAICHKQDMPYAVHHRNMLRMFRNE